MLFIIKTGITSTTKCLSKHKLNVSVLIACNLMKTLRAYETSSIDITGSKLLTTTRDTPPK